MTMRKIALAGIVASLALAFAVITAPVPVGAQIRILPECARTSGTPQNPRAPSIACALQTFGNVAQFILGVSGTFALVMFVYGGFVFVTAAGNESRVTEGKKVLTNAVIGILIIFFSGAVIRYGLSALLPAGSELVIGSPCQGGQGIVIQTTKGEIKCVTGPEGCEKVGDGDLTYECTPTAQAQAESNACIGSGPPLCGQATESCCTQRQ
jgi:hypothetical protein